MLGIGYARSDGRVGALLFAEKNDRSELLKTPTPTLVSLASTLPTRGREKQEAHAPKKPRTAWITRSWLASSR
jgi:hypothetical protein